MTPLHHLKRSLGTLLALGLILLVSLFVVRSLAGLGTQPAASPPENAGQATTVAGATNTAQGQDGAKPAAPTELPAVAAGKRPPACTFPLADIQPVESQPERYIFSEPQIVLSHPENLYDIVEWLPDNQQVLVTQDLNNARENGQPTKQSIELYNPETGDVQVYAIRYRIEEPPLWHPELRAVVYPAMNFMGFEENENKLKFTRQAWVSYGNPDAVQMLADNLEQFPLSVKPGNGQIVYLSDKKIFKKDGGLKDISSVTFNLAEWDYAAERKSDIPISYNMAWQPSTSLIFLYSSGDFEGGYTYILNSSTGQVCELKLDGWAGRAHWSEDGQYLAITRFRGVRPTESSDLAILDAVTGKLYSTPVVTAQAITDKHYVTDFAWAPDSRHILVSGSTLSYQSSKWVDSPGLYLVDFNSGQIDQILAAYRFSTASSRSSNLAWSPDGSKVLARCPTKEEERVCFILVQTIKK